jgi:digeranylgeranylglycerophospholipid reductase
MAVKRASNSNPDFDLVIVGASFAGLAAARVAAIRGLRVAVIESKREPGERIHTTGILVPEAAQEIDIPFWLTRRVPGVRLYAPNLKSMDLFCPGYAFLTTRTADLVRWLARDATKAGAKLICGTKFTGAERVGSLIRIDGLGLTTRFLIGADGARSRMARTFSLDRNTKFLTGVEVEMESCKSVDRRYLHCFVDSALAPGYIGWVAPGPDYTQIGLAVAGNAKPDLPALLEKTSLLFDWDLSSIRERRSGLIPCGGVLKRFADGNVMLIGDAAGWVSPMTAGGIRTAFRFGRLAGNLTADHLLNHGPQPQVLLAKQLPRFRLKGLLRHLLNIPMPNSVLNGALSTAPMRAFAQRLYFHRRGAIGTDFKAYQRWLNAKGPPVTSNFRESDRCRDSDGPI